MSRLRHSSVSEIVRHYLSQSGHRYLSSISSRCRRFHQIKPQHVDPFDPFLPTTLTYRHTHCISVASASGNRAGTRQEGQKPINYRPKINVKKIMEDEGDWIVLDNQRIHAWSISGIESCIVAKIDQLNMAFDMGYATRPSIKCSDVFISHGHIDHISAVVKHAAHRSLFSMKPATYHAPPHLVNQLRKMAENIGELHGGDENFSSINVKAAEPGEAIQLPGGFKVVPFPTFHRVPSQGYIVYRTKKHLKQEFTGMPSTEIGKLIKEGNSVHDVITVPELAYTGDTTFEVFKSPPLEDLLKVKTLITEATYIDDEVDKEGRGGVRRAQARGHIHLQEIIDNEELFNDIKNIVLVHFSDKYSLRYIDKKSNEILSDSLKEKVSLGVLMKEKLG